MSHSYIRGKHFPKGSTDTALCWKVVRLSKEDSFRWRGRGQTWKGGGHPSVRTNQSARAEDSFAVEYDGGNYICIRALQLSKRAFLYYYFKLD